LGLSPLAVDFHDDGDHCPNPNRAKQNFEPFAHGDNTAGKGVKIDLSEFG
jgi:hypothetical protein